MQVIPKASVSLSVAAYLAVEYKVPSYRPVWAQCHSAGEAPACWGPGPAGAAPGRGCSAADWSGNPGGMASGRALGWCASVGHEDREVVFGLIKPFCIVCEQSKKIRGVLLTMWSTLILLMPRGCPENKPRTARISDTVGFSPFCTWKYTQGQLTVVRKGFQILNFSKRNPFIESICSTEKSILC